MFDDQQTKGPNPPANLPIGEPASQLLQRGEPEDIFSGVEKTSGSESIAPAMSQPSALERGALRPRQEQPPAPQAGGQPDIYTVKEPVFARGLITVVAIVVILGILGGGGWFVYNKFIKGEAQIVTEETAQEQAAVVEEPATAIPVVEETKIESAEEQQNVEASETDKQVLFLEEPADKDGDGLDDAKEAEKGTDPSNWDTDGDELSDGDEVLLWKTDPSNPDTDGDTYSDGQEVKNGYNPNGAGKIFEPPKQ